MTIGFALVLNHGVLVVADGRITNALDVLDPRVTHDCNKIEVVQRHLLAVIGGVEMAGRQAAALMKGCDLKNPKHVIAAAAHSLQVGWSAFRERHPREYAANGPFRAALVLAGIDNFARPYVALVDQLQGAPLAVTGPRHDGSAFAIFSTDDAATSRVQNALSAITSLPQVEEQAALALARVAARTIGEIANSSPTIGGLVRAKYLSATGALDLAL